MILPNKYLEANRSLLGVGGVLLQHLDSPRSVTALWNRVRALAETGTFERFSLSLDFLYAIGMVELEDGLLRRCRQ